MFIPNLLASYKLINNTKYRGEFSDEKSQLLPRTGSFWAVGKKVMLDFILSSERELGQEMSVAAPLPDNNHNMIKFDI